MISVLPDLLQRFARRRPNDTALVTEEGSAISAAELDCAAWRGVRQLQVLGAGRGTVLALEGEPGPAWLAALFACWRAGVVAAPLNARQPPSERERAARAMACQLHWRVDADILQGSAVHAASAGDWRADQALLRVCTSGTTGAPRCVELVLRQFWYNTLGSNLRLGRRPGDRWLVCLPVNHVGALAALFRCLHNLSTVELHARFDAAVVGRRLDSGEVSLVSLVPAMLDAILDSRGPGPFPASLRAILLGGAPCSGTLLERCRHSSLPVALSWGMTETASQLATRKPGDLSALGEGLPPLPFVRLEVNETGRLVIIGPAARGRLVSDDLGEITAAGRVRVLGRSDQVMIRGGENIHPGEIESVLESHPGVREAVVLALDEPRLGQVPVAFVRATDLDPDTLLRWCREHLAGYKVPHRCVVLEHLPRSATGKVDRAGLLAMLDA